ncbi:MAG: adenylosuccinate synthase [Thermoplasmata archaeon]|nr:MAG: adenylosuccinate synthase [Thermoplasmata archaeon]
MPAIVIIGTQWGDEGKGKITDYYAERADFVVRFQGGNNAGHTIKIGEEVYKFHLLPSGVVRADKHVVIGNGLVVDPKVLLKEISELKVRVPESAKLSISDRANVILPYHLILDGLQEQSKGSAKIGTTGRGIGPCYMTKVARTGIRIGEFIDETTFREKLEQILPGIQKSYEALSPDAPKLDIEEIVSEYSAYGSELAQYVTDTSVLLNSALDENKTILFEGAQGTMLDVDFGTYPFVTSSNPLAGSVCIGAGVGPTKIDRVIGVVKAYTTRVGSGPMPTNLTDETGDYIREKGQEFGTTTGRPRNCGWLDLVVVSHSCRLNGITSFAITRLDVLGGLKELKICTGYNHKGTKIEHFPANLNVLSECEPVYDTISAWQEYSEEEWIKLAQKGYEALPEELKSYVNYIEDATNTPAEMLSVGPSRAATVYREIST